jgi:hypothetical protein
MQESNWRIGMWGPTASGKTTYLASLYLHRRKVGWDIQPLDPDDPVVRNFIDGEVNALASGRFPGATASGVVQGYELAFQVPVRGLLRTRPNDYLVRMDDVSGEEIGPRQTIRDEYFERLRECQGIVMLVDPEEEHAYGATFESYYSPLAQLVTQVDDGETYFAFCITKVDLDRHWAEVNRVPEEDKVAHQANLRRYLRQLITQAAWDEIEPIFQAGRARVFAVSSVGRIESPDGWRPNIIREYGQDAETRIIHLDKHWQPINIFEPLAWIFEKQSRLW